MHQERRLEKDGFLNQRQELAAFETPAESVESRHSGTSKSHAVELEVARVGVGDFIPLSEVCPCELDNSDLDLGGKKDEAVKSGRYICSHDNKYAIRMVVDGGTHLKVTHLAEPLKVCCLGKEQAMIDG